ncbi:hypothetical protein GSI_03322 [Ganoderma sinense ZZ0214-1]|uniref:JAB domain-containing protein n=1 Tax=Ganoderma sinense ZZ0214-1 TaxID=1077348 RepID=A0A2G8SLB1_9APHY|nr:hypothetical protein GSI_03322 [Ganoderma sinense ZZ0214-1]
MQVHTASSIPIFFVPSTVCLRKPTIRQHIIDRTSQELVRNKFTNAGASSVEVVGSYHTHGGAAPEWVTARVYDRDHHVICHQKADGSLWNCIHIFRNPMLNASQAERPVRFWAEEFMEARRIGRKSMRMIKHVQA